MKKKIAKHLLDIEAVFLKPNNPFTWASGIKSPIYCDNRLTLSYPRVRKDIEKALAKKVMKKFPEVEYIMGTATAGIAHAALVSNILKLPMGYVRSNSKTHGRENLIEGKIIKGAKVVVIEDLVSTGGSSIKVVDTLIDAGFDVLGVVSIFTYKLPIAEKTFENHNIPCYSICNYDILLNVALAENKIKKEDLNKLNKWKENPKNESWMN